MSKHYFKAAILLGFLFAPLFAECPASPDSTFDSDAQISVEGRFTNREFLPVHFSLSWRHVPGSADTFDIVLSGKDSFRYVSSRDFRYMEFRKENARRQMARHHLQEFIGESPLTWEHLENLARGNLPCEDSTENNFIHIHSWKEYDGLFLPAIVDFYGKGGHGSLWVRTARKISPNVSKDTADFPSIFRNWPDSKIKVPLILQMD